MGSLAGCFQSDAARGLPCTSDASCGSLSCEYGVCGGPTRCAEGAGVGDYCYVVTDEAFEVGEAPTALAIADVNGDFTRDIVTADAGSRGVSILLGDGTSMFERHDLGMPALASPPSAIGLGHLDGVGWSDLAVVTTDGAVRAVFVGEDGTLGSVADVATAVSGASRPTIADFVQDASGVRDVAVLGDEGVFVARNVDLSSFESSWRTTAVDSPRDMRTIQDAAGDPAFAYVARAADDDISSLDRKGDGTFSSVQSIPVGRGPVSFAIADLDSDDYVDVLVVSSEGGLWITKGKSAERDEWSPPEQVYDLGWVPSTLDVLDLDDDGDPDVVVSGATPDGHSDVFLLENDGEGRIIYGGSLGLRDASAAALADLDRDAVPEVVIAAAEDGTVRLARRAKAPPMPGDDDGTDDDTTGVSVGSASEDGPDDDGTDTGVDDGPLETGIDPTGDGECVWIGGAGVVNLERCPPMPVFGSYDHLAFARVDQDFYEDLVAVGTDEYGSRLVGLCTPPSYGDPYAGGGVPGPCLDLPLPFPATGVAGGSRSDGLATIAITHTDAVSLALTDPGNSWSLGSLDITASGLGEPRFYDLATDGQTELMFVGADGLYVTRIEEGAPPSLVYTGPGTHAPRGLFSAVTPEEGDEFMADIAFALEDFDGGTNGAILVIGYDPVFAEGTPAAPFVQDPGLLGIREFEFVAGSDAGVYLVGIVGADLRVAYVFVSTDGPPEVVIDDSFTGVTDLVVANLDIDPYPDDLVFIGSLLGDAPAVHVIIDDSEGERSHFAIPDVFDPTDLARWDVPCGPQQYWTAEILIATPIGIERVRSQNGCF